MGSLLAAIKIPDKPCPRFLRVSIETNTTKAYSGFYCITLFYFLGMLEHYRITPSMEFPGSTFTSGCSGGSRLCAKSMGGSQGSPRGPSCRSPPQDPRRTLWPCWPEREQGACFYIKVNTLETSCMKGTFGHIKNIFLRPSGCENVRDFPETAPRIARSGVLGGLLKELWFQFWNVLANFSVCIVCSSVLSLSNIKLHKSYARNI